MDERLNKNKIKPLAYLINKFQAKDLRFDVPRFCFLLGAGCSVTSNIPTASGIIQICQKLSFVDHHREGYQVNIELLKNFKKYLGRVDDFVYKSETEFKQFIKDKEEQFRQSLTKEYVVSRIPQNIINRIKSDCNIEGEELDNKLLDLYLEKIHQDSLYGKWFEEYSQDPRDRQKLIENIIEQQEISNDYIIFSGLINEGLIHNIFTTNFDDLINETLIIYFNKKARVYSHNEIARYISIASQKPNIIKLHGDYLFENIKNVGEETSVLEQNMRKKFSEALNSLDLVVIGYGGADHSIMSVIESIKEERPFTMLWCASSEEKLHWRIINLINNTQNSFFIEVQDFFNLVLNLSSKIKWDRFKNNLIDIANQRQNKLEQSLEDSMFKIKIISTIGNKEKEFIRIGMKSAVAAIMSRNMAHNIGSHVLTHLSDPTLLSKYKYNSLSKLNSYIKERMDFVANISSIPYTSVPTKLKKDILADFIVSDNNDKSPKILLDLLSASEGLNSNNIRVEIQNVQKSKGDITVDMPNGTIGVHAFYVILENIIRNTKHSDIDLKAGVTFTILYNQVKSNSNLIKIEIKDNLGKRNKIIRSNPNFLKKIREEIEKEIIDTRGTIRNTGLGMAEMKLAAAYLRKLDIQNIDNYKSQYPLLKANLDKELNLSFEFYLLGIADE